ncbi:MAG: WYL domain-containing protein [Clostridia bacterium]|nr:WYL domain-containing protein [Clostridia bacterium]
MGVARDARIGAIVDKLRSAGGKIDLEQAASEHGVCCRTIARDIARLRTMGYDIEIRDGVMHSRGGLMPQLPSSVIAMRRMAVLAYLVAGPAAFTEIVDRLSDPIRGFSADERTVRRDMDYLCTQGFVEECDSREESGYRLSGAFMPRFSLTCDELLSVLHAVEAAPEAVAEPAAVRSIREKLLAAVAPSASLARLACRRRYMKGRTGRFDPEIQNLVDMLEVASLEERVVRITYRSRDVRGRAPNGESCDSGGSSGVRDVEPLGLVYYWFHDAWYLVAQCRRAGEIRHFRLDRITGVVVTNSHFQYPDSFDLASHVSGMWGVFSGKSTRVRVRFFNEMNVFARLQAEAGDRPSCLLTPCDDGTTELSDTVAGLSEFRTWLRSFGSSAQVIEPKELAQELVDSAIVMRRIYAASPCDPGEGSRRPPIAPSSLSPSPPAVSATAGASAALRVPSRAEMTEAMYLRLIQIVNRLRSTPEGMTVTELADECGATPEMVAADLELLLSHGRVPLACSADDPDTGCDGEQKPEDEIWMLSSSDFSFPITSLSRHETSTILRILDRLPAGADVAGARDKVEAGLTAVHSSDEVMRAIGRRVVKAGRIMYGPGQEEQKVDALGKYVAGNAAIRVEYVGASGAQSERDTCAVALVYDWRTCAWYLYGFSGSEQFRHFKVSRIRNCRLSSIRIAPPSDDDVDAHVKSCWGVECSSEPVDVAVRFSNDFNVISRMRSDTADRASATYLELPDGSVIYRDTMPGCNEFRAWLATFGESAEALAPGELRASMAAGVERVLARYGIDIAGV